MSVKKKIKKRGFFSQKFRNFRENLFLRDKIEENILMDLT
jgi:hypothetical protein